MPHIYYRGMYWIATEYAVNRKQKQKSKKKRINKKFHKKFGEVEIPVIYVFQNQYVLYHPKFAEAIRQVIQKDEGNTQ